MHSVITISHDPIDIAAVLQSVADRSAGASLLFVGTTREFTAEKQTSRLEYQCYTEMAIAKMQQLRDQANNRWSLLGCSMAHRVGIVEIGEASVAIAVSSRHRGPAFEAGQWLIDTLKQDVPIWKEEHFADGTREWVHPQSTPPT